MASWLFMLGMIGISNVFMHVLLAINNRASLLSEKGKAILMMPAVGSLAKRGFHAIVEPPAAEDMSTKQLCRKMAYKWLAAS